MHGLQQLLRGVQPWPARVLVAQLAYEHYGDREGCDGDGGGGDCGDGSGRVGCGCGCVRVGGGRGGGRVGFGLRPHCCYFLHFDREVSPYSHPLSHPRVCCV